MKYGPLLFSPLGLIPAGLQSASAADIRFPVKAAEVSPYLPSWAGFYVGVNLGVISERSRQTAFLPAAPVGGSAYCWTGHCNFSNTQTAKGALAGVQFGYNFQSGNWVYGVEADFGLASADKTVSAAARWSGTSYTWTSQTGIDTLGTVRLRLGYAFDRALIYATGGLAHAKIVDRFQHASNVAPYTWSETGWRTGYAVGGGIEYSLTRYLSIKGEALYYDLGKKDHVSDIINTPFPSFAAAGLRDDMSGAVARVGINYHFQ